MLAGFRTAFALSAALLVSACASKNDTAELAALGPGGPGAGPGSVQEFTTTVGDRVFFPVDQTQITPEGRMILDRQAQWFARYPHYRILIEGHADERGTREYNFALSERRAFNVRAHLESRGVNPGRIRTVAYGKERPVMVCDNESCWSQNRRAVTTIDGAPGS